MEIYIVGYSFVVGLQACENTGVTEGKNGFLTTFYFQKAGFRLNQK